MVLHVSGNTGNKAHPSMCIPCMRGARIWLRWFLCVEWDGGFPKQIACCWNLSAILWHPQVSRFIHDNDACTENIHPGWLQPIVHLSTTCFCPPLWALKFTLCHQWKLSRSKPTSLGKNIWLPFHQYFIHVKVDVRRYMWKIRKKDNVPCVKEMRFVEYTGLCSMPKSLPAVNQTTLR